MIRRDKTKKQIDTRMILQLRASDKNIVCLCNIAKSIYRDQRKNADRLVTRLQKSSYNEAVITFNKLFGHQINLTHR